MYQVSVTLGKSGGTDAAIVQVPVATAAAAGTVAINVGETTGLTVGQIGLRARECMNALIEASRQSSAAVLKAEMPVSGGKAAIVLSATNALTAETSIAAVRNVVTGLDGQTTLIHGALVQALELLRETALTGALTIKP